FLNESLGDEIGDTVVETGRCDYIRLEPDGLNFINLTTESASRNWQWRKTVLSRKVLHSAFRQAKDSCVRQDGYLGDSRMSLREDVDDRVSVAVLEIRLHHIERCVSYATTPTLEVFIAGSMRFEKQPREL